MNDFLREVRTVETEAVPAVMVKHNVEWVDIQAHIYEETGELICECGVLAHKIRII